MIQPHSNLMPVNACTQNNWFSQQKRPHNYSLIASTLFIYPFVLHISHTLFGLLEKRENSINSKVSFICWKIFIIIIKDQTIISIQVLNNHNDGQSHCIKSS